MPPVHTAQAVHEVVVEEYRILDSVNYELATYTPADWMCLFETRFSLSVEHLRQRFPQRTGSLLSLLARVPSGVLASLALCLASDFVRDRPLSLESTPSRIGSSARFLSCLVWVSFLLSGAQAAAVPGGRWQALRGRSGTEKISMTLRAKKDTHKPKQCMHPKPVDTMVISIFVIFWLKTW